MTDSRAAAWESRLKAPVVGAALAVIPLLALSLTRPEGPWHTVEVVGHWAVWIVFAVEVAIMLCVVDDRRAWMSGHRYELVVVAASSPFVPLALAVAPALRLLIVVKAFKTLKLAKAIKLAKLHKSDRLVRRRLTLTPRAAMALGAVSFALGVLTVGYMLTGQSPLEGDVQTACLLGAGALIVFGAGRALPPHGAAADRREHRPASKSSESIGPAESRP